MNKKIKPENLMIIEALATLISIMGAFLGGVGSRLGFVLSGLGMIMILIIILVGCIAVKGTKKYVIIAWGLMIEGLTIYLAMPVQYIYAAFVIWLIGIILGFSLAKKTGVKMNKSATATLININESKMYSRQHMQQPEIELTYEFYTDNGMKVTAKEKTFLSASELSQLQIGARIPIKYQANSPENANYNPNYQGF